MDGKLTEKNSLSPIRETQKQGTDKSYHTIKLRSLSLNKEVLLYLKCKVTCKVKVFILGKFLFDLILSCSTLKLCHISFPNLRVFKCEDTVCFQLFF